MTVDVEHIPVESHSLTAKDIRTKLRDPLEQVLLIDEMLKYGEEEGEGQFLSSKSQIPASVEFEKGYGGRPEIPLAPIEQCRMAVQDLMFQRRSIREYADGKIPFKTLSSLLVYAYGIRRIGPAYNRPKFLFRTAPSSGGLQGVELYFIANRVEGLSPGLYHLKASRNCVEQVFEGYLQGKILELCSQDTVATAGIVVILTMVLPRGLWKYLSRYYKFLLIDVGCVAENIHLVATALGLGSCMIAAFQQEGFAKLLQLDRHEIPALLLSLGTVIEPLPKLTNKVDESS